MIRKTINFINYLYEAFLDLIYNKKCLICGCSKIDNLLCKTCSKDVHYLSGFQHRIYNGISIFSCVLYQTNVKKLIHLLKFKHKKSCAIVLAKIMFTYFKKLNLEDDFIIIYPPSYFTKNLSRGYEHMFLIAKEFQKLTNFKIERKLLKKIKYTKPQYKAKNRHKNIKGSFDINKDLILKYQNSNILLIDDITTSGATLNEIIDLLLNNGFSNITCLTVSKVK